MLFILSPNYNRTVKDYNSHPLDHCFTHINTKNTISENVAFSFNQLSSSVHLQPLLFHLKLITSRWNEWTAFEQWNSRLITGCSVISISLFCLFCESVESSLKLVLIAVVSIPAHLLAAGNTRLLLCSQLWGPSALNGCSLSIIT